MMFGIGSFATWLQIISGWNPGGHLTPTVRKGGWWETGAPPWVAASRLSEADFVRVGWSGKELLRDSVGLSTVHSWPNSMLKFTSTFYKEKAKKKQHDIEILNVQRVHCWLRNLGRNIENNDEMTLLTSSLGWIWNMYSNGSNCVFHAFPIYGFIRWFFLRGGLYWVITSWV